MAKNRIYHHKDAVIGAIADQESVTRSIRWLDEADFWLSPSSKNPDKLVISDLRDGFCKKGFFGWLIRFYLRAGGMGMFYFHTLDCGAKIVEGGPDVMNGEECESYADAIKKCEDVYMGKAEAKR